MFTLHNQLVKDCVPLGDFPLCHALMMNDAQYPWLILVPRRENTSELFQLSRVDQHLLLAEANSVAAALAGHFNADKMNIAALGNVVPQLHVHVIARFRDDPAWPRPVWGAEPVQPYSDSGLRQRLQELEALLVPLGLQWAPATGT